MRDLASSTWKEIADFAPGAVALIPVASIEAHGPHLPLNTDEIIALETARRAAAKIESRGRRVLLFPPVVYSPAPFAREFAGTVSAHADGLRRTLESAAAAARAWGASAVAFVNGHLDPAHVKVVREAADAAGAVFPDMLRGKWARLLSDEFKQGGPHAGRFETSLVLAARPEAVRDEVRRALKPVNVNLGKAIKDGCRTFREAGGSDAYFGDPAAATADEGRATYEILSDMVVEEVLGGTA